MTRHIHDAVLRELGKDRFTLVSLLHIDFATPLTLTDAAFAIDYQGHTYTPSGHVLAINSVSETAVLRVGTLRLELAAVEPTLVGLFLNNDYLDTRLRYYKALLDSRLRVIGEPLLFFDGHIAGLKGRDARDRATLTLEVAGHWANFQTRNGRKTNPTSQRIHFPRDQGLAFAAHTVRDILWGRT